MSDLLHHVAFATDWAEARAAGKYAISTRGRTLAEEGFIHASYQHQWRAVRDRFYADVTEPLVLLVIDPVLLDAEVRVEPVPDSDEEFPHVYGPIPVGAVVEVRPLTGEA